jgi:2-keto-4-pentenoate hydratase/2-oxohepta-3-ene-1,7-dioic acid hydratase in catechol pathway
MRLGRLGPIGAEVPVVWQGKDAYDLRGVCNDIDGAFWSSDQPDEARRRLEAGDLPLLDGAEGMRVGAPIARPSAVVCVGLNYAAHAAESGVEPPTQPVIFLKTPNTVGGPNDDVRVPLRSNKTDWEVELGVLIGRPTGYLSSPEESLACVAGFVLTNDLSERTFQLAESGGQWSKGKCCPGFTPTGPWLVTPDELDHGSLALRSWVNGEPRQDSTTADMVFGVEYLVWHLSQYLAFEPGDLLLTGTPEGVGLSGRFPYLRAGDVCEVEIPGLGRQRQTFV